MRGLQQTKANEMFFKVFSNQMSVFAWLVQFYPAKFLIAMNNKGKDNIK